MFWGSLGYLGDSLNYHLQSSSSYNQSLLANLSPCPVLVYLNYCCCNKGLDIYWFLHNNLNSYFRQHADQTIQIAQLWEQIAEIRPWLGVGQGRNFMTIRCS